MIGRAISHYEILEKLGEGGMGVVYKAWDTHLDRPVAIKLLPPEKVADPERQRRFVQEARAASALNHPNIITVYDIDESEGLHFIAMECVEGKALDQLIRRQRLRLNEALKYAVQVADALAAAHGAGIVHRDLKPGNVMVTDKGQVKLLDFGLAKLVETAPSNGWDATRTFEAATEERTICGTFAYMSPEQAEAKPVDARSDIFSFGVLLYEMLTSERAFDGATERSLLTAILTRDAPPVSSLEPSAPPALDRAVKRCLAKDPGERWQSAADLRDELRWIAEQVTAAPSAAVPAPMGAFRAGRWALIGALTLAVLTAAAIWVRAPRPARELPLRQFRLAAEQQPLNALISPDGRRVAYQVGPEGRSAIWVQDLDRDEPREIVAMGTSSSPFWSPDSDSIGFFAETVLKRVSVHGGAAVTVCNLPSEVIGGGMWTSDGQSMVFSSGNPTRIHEVPAQGGSPKVLVQAAPSEAGQNFVDPQFLPVDGGRRFLLFSIGGASRPYQIVLQDLAAGRRSVLGPGRRPVYSPTGHIVYEDRDRLWALPLSLGGMAATGPSFPIQQNAEYASVSAEGTLAFVGGRRAGPEQLVWKDRNGHKLGVIGQPQDRIYTPKLSPDGSRVAVWGRENDNDDIWVHDAARNLKLRLTYHPALEDRPIWFPDGRQITFASHRNGNADIFVQAADGSGEAQELLAGAQAQYPEHWSPDGKYLICDFIAERRRDIWYLRRRAGETKYEAVRLLATEFDEAEPNFSPDGRFIAYSSDESGRREIYIRRFPDGGGKLQISTNGGGQPRWRADGRELFYVEAETLMAVPVTTTPKPRVGPAQRLFEHVGIARRPGQQYDVSADGRRFVVIETVGGPSRPSVRVVQNWFAAFREPKTR